MFEKDIKYYVNKEKGAVTAVIKDREFDALCFSKRYIPDAYSGVAICKEEDVFDEEVGKRVARKKALRSYYKEMKKVSALREKELKAEIGRASCRERV